MKQVSGSLKLELSQYAEMQAFAQFGSDLDTATKNALTQGERITEILKQPQYSPLSVAHQVVILYAATRKYLLDIAVEDIRPFEKGLFEFIATRYAEIPEAIKVEKVLSEETEEKLVKAITEYKEEFKNEL